MESQWKIGIVCYPTYGGSGALATELGRQLAGRGHEIHFISYSRPFRIAHDYRSNIYHHQIDTIEHPLFLGPLYSISAAVRIADIIRAEDLDILHVHYALPHAVCAFLANEMLAPRKRVPVLTTLHGTDITLIGNTPAYRPAVKLGLDKSDGLTCVSQWLSDATCKYFDICDRLNVIHNFIDPETFSPRADPKFRARFSPGGEPVLLHVSNFRPVKRVMDVVRMFACVAKEHPARLLMVGDGPDREPARALAAELGVADHVLFIGEQEDVERFFRISDLLIFPSDGESFGLAAAEAMACEVPVIGSAAGGLPEVVIEGEHGFLCPVGDHQAMARRSLELLRDPDRRREMGAAGRRRVLENFSPELIVPRYENQYAFHLNCDRPGAGTVSTHASPVPNV